MACPNENIAFYLYTRYLNIAIKKYTRKFRHSKRVITYFRSTADSPELLNVSDVSSIKSAGFVKGSPLKILIHGYTGFRDYSPNTEIRPGEFLLFSEIQLITKKGNVIFTHISS